MANIAANITDLVGNTPLLEPSRFIAATGADPAARILVKIEAFNPSFSVKDRAATSILKGALESGEVQPGGTVVEATSGNIGIAIAAAAAALGLKAVIFMPASMSIERRKIIAHLGAELRIVNGPMDKAVAEAKEYVATHPGAYATNQFGNPLNVEAHYKGTGPEVWRDTDGEVAAFIAGIGSAGTIIGAGHYLREQNPDIVLIGAEPAESPLLTEGHASPHGIQGIGPNLVPDIFEAGFADEILTVPTARALELSRLFSKTEGLLIGISSGAALDAALRAASRPELAGKTIVAILPDTGERYISTKLFEGDAEE